LIPEDERLIYELSRGNREALRKIYMKYKDSLLTIAAAMLNDSAAAEDILHDVFITLARCAKRLELRVNLKNYLIASIANKVRDKYRKKTHTLLELEKAGHISSQSHDPEKSAIFDEQFRLIADALYKLPFEQRESIILHITGSMKFREIAKMLKISTSTVQGRYRYGIDKLRKELIGDNKDESRR